MNPISTLNAISLQTRIDNSKQKLRLYSSLKKISRIAIPLFGFLLLIPFGLLNPRSLSISSTLLLVAYSPCLEVAVGTFENWSYQVQKEVDKQTRIQQGLSEGKPIYQAWIEAIPETPIPAVDEQMREVRDHPGSEEKRRDLWEAEKVRALHRLENGRRKFERAFINYVRDHPEDTRMLSDFGTYQKWQIEHLMNDLPFTVFVRSDGHEFTNLEDCSRIFI